MKNKLFDIILFVFLLNNNNIFSSNDTIKEVEPIESIHSDEKKSVSSDIIDKENIISENSLSEESILEAPRKDYTSDELKTTNIISTNKDLKTNKKEENSREDKFEEITDRTNRITALGSAMGAVDLSKTPTKKFRVGAGVGHSANNQAVAVGIGYAPTERLRLNTKVSTTTNSTKSNRSNGISIGASYDLDW